MTIRFLYILLIFILPYAAFSQNEFSVVFYNVENLFDTIDDPHKNDNQFLPTGSKNWDTPKYYHKLKNLSKAIIATSKWLPADIIGICEVENNKCVWDLISKTPLQRMRYKVIHYESPDQRGIDVACIYNPKTVEVISSQNINVSFKDRPRMKTRDILHVHAYSKTLKDSLHFFFCHFPSRYGGAKESEFKRITASKILKTHTDSISLIQPNSKIIIMGDFNDTPTNKSIKNITKSGNFSSCVDSTFPGTYNYKNLWSNIDQCIINSQVQNSYTYKYSITDADFLLSTNSKNQNSPFRSYKGSYYNWGYSDHLPILLMLKR